MDNAMSFMLGIIAGGVFTVILTASCLSDLKKRYEIKDETKNLQD